MLKEFTNRLPKLRLPLVICLAFIAGVLTTATVQTVHAHQERPPFALFVEAWEIVNNHFVDRARIDFTKMVYGAIEGMLNTLGDANHTSFSTPAVARMQADALAGSFVGIGAQVTMDDGQFQIVAPLRGAPAAAAGIVAGDRVLAVDGIAVTGKDDWEIINLIQGTAGTTVVLTVIHPGEHAPVDLPVVRKRIDLQSVAWVRIPQSDLAYLQLSQFTDGTGAALRSALQALQIAPPTEQPIRGILLDLRNNPGGYLHEALTAASQFLPTDTVILHERDAKGAITTHRAQQNGLARALPLVVLANGGTASAAEILAGALQDNQRAQVVGATTVGTGTVLQQFTLSDGSVIRLGVTNWLTPKFHLIKNQGIRPHIAVPQEQTLPLVDPVTVAQLTATGNWSTTDHQYNMGLFLLRLATLRQADERSP
jgi:carboxyl-terminal processing protease